MTTMLSLALVFMLTMGGNPGYISSHASIPNSTISNPTEIERERNIFLDHVDNITKIDETKNGETTQITTELPLDNDNFFV